MGEDDRQAVLAFAREQRKQLYQKLGATPSNPNAKSSLAVHNLLPQIEERDVLAYLLQAGPVKSVHIVRKPSYVYATVEMDTIEDAVAAVRMFHGKFWNGQRLHVDYVP